MNDLSTKIKSTSTTAVMDTNRNNNNSNPPLKRTRAKRSCDFCRKRKARCDADHTIPCTNCKAWGFNCEFLTVRKKRGPPSVYVENLEIRCKKMEALLTSLTKSSIKEIERNDFRPDSYTNCTIKNNISSYQPCIKENCQDLIEENDEEEDMDDDNSSLEDDDEDSEYSNSQRNNSTDDISAMANMEETLANLNLEDYDSIKYTGHSAGLQLLDENLFKSKSYVQWPGRQDVALRLMAPNELLVVRSADRSISGKKKLDTRLDVGFSLTSSIFDEKNTPWHLAPGSLSTSTKSAANKDLPSNSIIEKAVKLYFSHIHTFLPIVNKTRFETHDMKSSNVLVQAVLAVAFRFASRHFPKLFQKKSALYADTYFRKVMLRLQDSYRARLRHVQAALLMTLYLDMDETDVESMQWYTLGKAIRMAQDIGLHRSCSNWNLPPSEIETRHRVFYGLYILDRLMSARAGKPLTILDRDFDTDLPVPYEVFDNATAKQGPSIYHSFISLIKLAEILGRILKALYAPKSKHSNSNANLDDPTILAVFDRRLKNWKATLDQSEGGVTVSPAQKVNLLLFYYTAMLLLHRPFIEFSSDNIKATTNMIQGSVDLDTLAADSRQACENAASNISVIIRQKQSLMSDPDSYSPLCLPTCFVYSMFQSSLINLAIAMKNRDSLRRLRLLKRSIALLKQHEQLASAQRAHHILVMLVAINNINLENLLENEATREEDNVSVLREDCLSNTSPISPIPSNKNSNELQFTSKSMVPSHQGQQPHQQLSTQLQTVNTNHVIPSCEDNMPKSSWYQRMMNTSIIGGITPDLHQNMTGMSSSHTLEQLLPYAHNINRQQQSAQHQNNTTLYQRQDENDMHGHSHYNDQQNYYDLAPTVSSSLNNTIPTSSPLTATKRTDIYNKHHDANMYDASDDMRNNNNNNIPSYNHGPTLLSHQHMSFQRNGMTSTPLHQTPLPFTAASSYGSHSNSSQHSLTHHHYASSTATTAASTPSYPTLNYLPPSSLNWSDWGVYLGQQNSSIPPPPPPQLEPSPPENHTHLHLSR